MIVRPLEWLARHWSTVSIGVASALFFGYVGAKNTLVGVNTDAVFYLTMADFYGPFREVSRDMVDHLVVRYPFPPLFPLVLGAAGGGLGAPVLSYWLGAVCLGLVCSLIMVWVRRAGGSAIAALSVPLIFALMPATLIHTMGIFSEPLYLIFLLTGLIVLPPDARLSRRWLMAGSAIGCAAITRSVGLFAVAGFALVWAWRTRGLQARAALLIALFIPGAWSVFKWTAGWQGSYIASFDGAGMLTLIIEQLPHNLQALRYHSLRLFDLLGSGYAAVTLSVLLVPMAITLVNRLRSVELDAVYVSIYIVVIACWPFPNDFRRFLWVLAPFALAYGFMGTSFIIRTLGKAPLERLLHGAYAAALLALCLPSALQILLQIQQHTGTNYETYVRTSAWYHQDSQAKSIAVVANEYALAEAIAAAARFVPDEACVTATVPGFVHLHMHRRSLHAPLKQPELMAQLKTCSYVLMLDSIPVPPMGYSAYYPFKILEHELEILHVIMHTDHDIPRLILGRYTGATAP